MKKISFFGLAVFTGLVIGLGLAVKLDFFTLGHSENEASLKKNIISSEGLPNMETAIIDVANNTGKAVVSISTEYTEKVGRGGQYYFGNPFGGQSPFGEDDPFKKFFEDFFGQLPQREYRQSGLGSGVIIDEEGYILTNEHVVKEADKISVTLPDGRKFKAELKGQDPRSDLAVIKINAKKLPVAKLGDSDKVKIGEWVVAIGNPFGFALDNPEPTVTVGVVSALHRSLGRMLSQDKDYSDLIQTDAAINPGNSGGALVNLKGEVVGINVAIFTTSGGYQGIGFAVPINNAKRILSKLIEGKKISYGWLGVTVQDLNEDLVKYFGLSDKNGILVANVLEGSPAEKAGIKQGDVIVRYDNNEIKNVKELVGIVGKTEVGRKVKVELIRDKKPVKTEVTIGERPEDLSQVSIYEESGQWRGISVEEINADNARRFRLQEDSGVVVSDIEPGSPADDAGLLPGDVIKEINKKQVNSISDYKKITKDLKGDCLVVTLRGYFVVKGESKKD